MSIAAVLPHIDLSVVVITLNEADQIARCLSPFKAIQAQLKIELIVVDSGSTDTTVEVAKSCGAQVYHQDWLGFGAQKNAAIERASGAWVLLLDADEWLTQTEAEKLPQALRAMSASTTDVYRLLRRTHFLGRAMRFGSFARERVARLFRPNLRYYHQPVHEQLDVRGARVGHWNIEIEHNTARSAIEYQHKLEKYARIWASSRPAPSFSTLRGIASASAYLIRNLILRIGILDGPKAWQFHWLHARYSFMKYRLLAKR